MTTEKIRYVTLMLIKLASDILFSEKYLDCEIIVVSVGLEISRDRNIQIWFIIITRYPKTKIGWFLNVPFTCYNVARVAHQILGTQLMFVLVKADTAILFLLLFSSIRKQFLLDNSFVDEFDSFLFLNHNVCSIHNLINSYWMPCFKSYFTLLIIILTVGKCFGEFLLC